MEASSTPTICRLSDSRRHQLSAIAHSIAEIAITARMPEDSPNATGASLISRRCFLWSASVAALSLEARVSARANGRAGGILLGLTSPVYFSGFNPFLNWWKVASAPVITRSSGKSLYGQEIWDNGGYLDGLTGEIISPAPEDLVSISRVFFKSANKFQVGAGCNYFGEEWIATWEGGASGRIDFAGALGTQDNVGPNKIRFRTGPDPDQLALSLDLLDRAHPPKNVQIFQSRYVDAVDQGEIFNPDWLAEVGRFKILRFMDWMSTNNSTISEFSQLAGKSYFAWGQLFNSVTENGEFGPRGGMHPEIICELANKTRCNLHVCIPIRATEDFVKTFATFLRDHTDVEVTYELSNECWNQSFGQFHYCKLQGERIWPGDLAGMLKWYGFRAAQFMSIISGVYNEPNRWRGAIATQTVATTLQNIAGVEYWRKNQSDLSRAMGISNLFRSLYVTGYFGDGLAAKEIIRISEANPGVVVCRAHGFYSGQRVKLFITNGPTQLNDQFATVANPTADTFELSDVSTLSMGKELPSCRMATSESLPSSVYESSLDGFGESLTGKPGKPLLIDQIPLSQNDIVLVKDQQAGFQNGVYRVVHSGNESRGWLLARVSYFDKTTKIHAGTFVRIEYGTYADQIFVLDSNVDTTQRSEVRLIKVEPRNYVVDSSLFDIIDESNVRHISDAASFPTKYTYFNQQVARALIEGSCDSSFRVRGSVAALIATYWPPQLAVAVANGLTLRQYEGGCGLAGEGMLCGNPRALSYGGNERFGEYLFNFGNSYEASLAYSACYAAFWRIGGEYPAKFVAEGRSSSAGAWAGIRYWPLQANHDTSDALNPVWAVTVAANIAK